MPASAGGAVLPAVPSSSSSPRMTAPSHPPPPVLLGGTLNALCRLGSHGPVNLLRQVGPNPPASSTSSVTAASASAPPGAPQGTLGGKKRKLHPFSAAAQSSSSNGRSLPSPMGGVMSKRPRPTMTTSLSTSVLPAAASGTTSWTVLASHRHPTNRETTDSQYRRNSSLGTISSAAAATYRQHQLQQKQQQRQQFLQEQHRRLLTASSSSPTMAAPPPGPAPPTTGPFSTVSEAQSPSQYLRIALGEWGVPPRPSRDQGYFDLATPGRLQAYDRDLLAAVRRRDLQELRSERHLAHPTRPFVNACNPFGESILHLACRKGMTDVVRFLCEEGKVSPFCCDDYGRTALHDACWTASPQWSLVDYLMEWAPLLLTMEDVRGHLPLDYVRRADWALWVSFLTERREALRGRLTKAAAAAAAAMAGTVTTTPPVTDIPSPSSENAAKTPLLPRPTAPALGGSVAGKAAPATMALEAALQRAREEEEEEAVLAAASEAAAPPGSGQLHSASAPSDLPRGADSHKAGGAAGAPAAVVSSSSSGVSLDGAVASAPTVDCSTIVLTSKCTPATSGQEAAGTVHSMDDDDGGGVVPPPGGAPPASETAGPAPHWTTIGGGCDGPSPPTAGPSGHGGALEGLPPAMPDRIVG
jgi:hypothetical protein